MQPELETFIKENLAEGVTKDQIRQSLLQNGWKTSDIDNAFSQLEVTPSLPLSSLPPFPIIQQSNPVPQIQTKEKKPLLKLSKPKILILLIVILILSVGTGGSYLYLNSKTGFSDSNPSSETATPEVNSPSEDTTSSTSQPTIIWDWKTYNSQKYGVSFKYPLDWILNELDVEPDLVVTANSPDEHYTNGILDKGYKVYVNYSPVKANRSLDDLEKLIKDNPVIYKEFTRTMLNGQEALKFLFQPPGTAIRRFEYIVIAFGHEVQFWCYYALSDANGRSQCETIGSTLIILK